MPSAPAIYVRTLTPNRLGWPGRLAALAVAASSLAVLLVAARLQPDPAGIGSHETLGLDPCQFEIRTGVPCPTCGMTTAFAHFVRAQFLGSLYVQPMGMLLAAATAAAVWVAGYAAVTGRPVYRMLRFIPPKYYLAPFFALTILAWAWKIWIHLTGRDGWA